MFDFLVSVEWSEAVADCEFACFAGDSVLSPLPSLVGWLFCYCSLFSFYLFFIHSC